MTNIYTVAESLRSIRYTDDKEWLTQLLMSLPIPKTTVSKFKVDLHKGNNKYAKLLNRAEFVISNKALYQSLVTVQGKKLPPLVIHVNNGDVSVFNKNSCSVTEFRTEDIADNVDSLLGLIYGNLVRRDVSATRNLASTIAQLSNQLITENAECPQELCSKFILDLTTICIAHSFVKENFFDLFAKKTSANQKLDYAETIHHLMQACAGSPTREADALLPKGILTCISGTVSKKIVVTKKSFDLCMSLLLFDAKTLDAELLASSIYKFVNSADAAGIYGHQTNHQNALLLLNPLFLDELRKLNEQGETAAKHILLKRIYQLRFFDPTDGPGCFLSSALRSLMELEVELMESLGINEKSKIRLENFVGLVSNPTCQQLSKLTVWLTYMQFTRDDDLITRDYVVDTLKLASIHLGNQLDTPWDRLCEIDNNSFIIGSPKFCGSRKMSKEEKSSLSTVFMGEKLGDCDLASGWLVKASSYVKNVSAKAAFILTNSVCQGSQVSHIWPQIFSNETRISFARPSMKWRGGNERVSEVTVVLIGLENVSSSHPCRIFHGAEYVSTNVIGPYLVAGTNLVVYERRKPLVNFIPEMKKGNMPYDNGHLLFDEKGKDQLLEASPIAARFLKRIVGSDEFINNKKRWCLWIPDDSLKIAESIPEIAERIALVKKFRSEKTDAGAVRLASRPHQFRETRSTTKQTLVVPSVSSENRKYIPIGFVGNGVIISNLAFAIYECEPWVFSILTSRIHNLWIRTVCGALETRLRYSNTLGYNTFPFQTVSDTQKKTLNEFTRDIIFERERYSEVSLGDLYSKLPETLRIKHEYLDFFVDSLFRKTGFRDDDERLEYLFKDYKAKV
jgi:hypothetical protein